MKLAIYILAFLSPFVSVAELELTKAYYSIDRLWAESISKRNQKEKNEKPMDPFEEEPISWRDSGERKRIIESYLSWNPEQSHDEVSLYCVVALEELGMSFSSIEGSHLKFEALSISLVTTQENLEILEKLSEGLAIRKTRPNQSR